MGEMDECMKRCLCGAWYECILWTRKPENCLFLLATFGSTMPHVCTKEGDMDLLASCDKNDETNIQCVCDDMMQTRTRKKKKTKNTWFIVQQGDIQAW